MEQQEWNKLNALRLELNNHLMSFDCSAQEKFTELLVKSLEGKSDSRPSSDTRTE